MLHRCHLFPEHVEAGKVSIVDWKLIGSKPVVAQTSSVRKALSEDRLDSDEFWVKMLKTSFAVESHTRKRYGVLTDLRVLEVASADRRALWNFVKTSYSRREDTLSWTAAVLLASGMILVPLLGVSLGLLFAVSTSAIWTAVHAVRRL